MSLIVTLLAASVNKSFYCFRYLLYNFIMHRRISYRWYTEQPSIHWRVNLYDTHILYIYRLHALVCKAKCDVCRLRRNLPSRLYRIYRDTSWNTPIFDLAFELRRNFHRKLPPSERPTIDNETDGGSGE